MAHDHGCEYQIRTVHENGIEELSDWMNSKEQIAQALVTAPKPHGRTYWLRVRSIICPDCSDKEQIWEYPVMHLPSPRFVPHAARYLQIEEFRNQYAQNRHL
jgi:hypothetical protein